MLRLLTRPWANADTATGPGRDAEPTRGRAGRSGRPLDRSRAVRRDAVEVTRIVRNGPDSDEALMQSVRDGDLQAFQILYERHHRAVFAVALRSLGDRPAAEDVLQETFLRVYTGRREYRPLAAFRSWLFTIARHQVIDQVRKCRAGSPLESDDPLERVSDPTASPLQEVEARELSDRLGRALARLPRARREVVLLSRVAGLGHEEVARVTGQSPAAVRVALHRALRELQALLGRP